MKSCDLRALPLEELDEKMAESMAQAFKLRVDNTSKDLKNTALIRKTRRDIARIKQTIAEKKAASAAASQAKA